ncbi:uncharacterized protein [Branchiostoma lanceolatum]|uniref:uncharacterized protein n=1 Tax=Branchiostoma lanceolatum TaxID=7740 RepID=UPI003451540F
MLQVSVQRKYHLRLGPETSTPDSLRRAKAFLEPAAELDNDPEVSVQRKYHLRLGPETSTPDSLRRAKAFLKPAAELDNDPEVSVQRKYHLRLGPETSTPDMLKRPKAFLKQDKTSAGSKRRKVQTCSDQAQLQPKGLTNPGDNRCYVNAAIQCLTACGVGDYFINNENDDLLHWLGEFMSNMYGQTEVVDTTELIGKIRGAFSPLHGRGEHDCLDFIQRLLDRMEGPWNVKFVEKTKCNDCGWMKEQSQTHCPIHLHPDKVDGEVILVSELLHLRLVQQSLVWNELPCKVKGHNGNREISIDSSGNLLLVGLERFSRQSTDSRPLEVEEQLSIGGHAYQLMAILCHTRGPPGHYIAKTLREGQWHTCDDSRVKRCNIKNDVSSRDFRLFFYKECDTDQLVQEPGQREDSVNQANIREEDPVSCGLQEHHQRLEQVGKTPPGIKRKSSTSTTSNRASKVQAVKACLQPKDFTNPAADDWCYLNTTMQCLIASGFGEHLTDQNYPNDNFMLWLGNFIRSHSQLVQHEVVHTTELIGNIRSQLSSLHGTRQHDAAEFIALLMERMDGAWTVEYSVETTCNDCTMVSKMRKKGPIHVSTNICENAVLAISGLLHLHLLSDRCIWSDLPCQTEGHAGNLCKEMTSQGCLLVVVLLRYDITTRSKDSRPVHIEEQLEIKRQDYRLVAILCHIGELNSGHYIAYTFRSGQWYICDDRTVDKCRKIQNEITATNSYIFFYKRCDTSQTHNKQPSPNMPEDDCNASRFQESAASVAHQVSGPPPGPPHKGQVHTSHGTQHQRQNRESLVNPTALKKLLPEQKIIGASMPDGKVKSFIQMPRRSKLLPSTV